MRLLPPTGKSQLHTLNNPLVFWMTFELSNQTDSFKKRFEELFIKENLNANSEQRGEDVILDTNLF